jgi:hypothetical protein
VASLSHRLERQARLQARLAALADDELSALGTGTVPGAWGVSGTVDLDGDRLFVKRLPLTDLEVANPGSTANHFDLPTFYQYGVGSAGFGATRELASVCAASDLVAEGVNPSFPLVYHHRVMPRTGTGPTEPRDREAYVARWGGSRSVGRYVDARRNAVHELWLILEHHPTTYEPWLLTHQSDVERGLEQLFEAIGALRQRGIVHFDAHLQNVVCDDDQVYLVDFGLACSPSFDLTPAESAFLARHRHYDLGSVVFGLGQVLLEVYRSVDEGARRRVDQVCGVTAETSPIEVLTALVDRAGDLTDPQLLGVDVRLTSAIERRAPVIVLMGRFLHSLATDAQKRPRHDEDALVAALDACGIPR